MLKQQQLENYLILEKNYQADFEIVENVKTIGEDRGGGYGSTGN